MKSTLTEASPTERILDIEVPRERFTKIFDTKVKKYSKEIKLNGFRAGQVPKQVIATRYKDPISREALQELVEAAVKEACQTHNLEPIAPGVIENLEDKADQPILIKAKMEIDPPLDVKDYKLDLPIEAEAVTDEKVEHELEQLQRMQASDTVVDREAKIGDLVNAKYLSIIVNGDIKQVDENQKLRIELGKGSIREFDESLVGAKADQDVRITITFPMDYSSEELRGAKGEYQVHIEEVREISLPTLDDEFAKNNGANSIDALRLMIRTSLERSARDVAKGNLYDMAIRRVIDSNPFEVPKARIQYYLERKRKNKQGQNQDDHDHDHEAHSHDDHDHEGHDHEHDHAPVISPQEQEDAVFVLKRARILDEISKKEKIKATQAEVDSRVVMLSARYGVPFESLKAELRQSGRINDIREELRMEKTMDFIIGALDSEAAPVATP